MTSRTWLHQFSLTCAIVSISHSTSYKHIQVSCFLEANETLPGTPSLQSPESHNSSPYFLILYSHLSLTFHPRANWSLPLPLHCNWQNIFQFLSHLISAVFVTGSYSEVFSFLANLLKYYGFPVLFLSLTYLFTGSIQG